MTTPDVRYRLTADDLQVLAAFRRIKAESDKASAGVSRGFLNVNGTLSKVQSLAGTVATAIAAIGFARLVRDANDAVETLENMHSRLATNVTDLNAIDVALRRMQSSLPEAGRQFTAFFDLTADAARGVADAADKFRRLGATDQEIKRFATQDLAQRLETVAKAARRIGDEKERTAAFINALGARGAVLIPILEQIANVGMKGLREQAVGLGADVDGKAVESMGKLNDEFDDLAIASRGLATQFLSGFAPDMTKALDAVTSAMARNKSGWQVLGEISGKVLGLALINTVALADSIVTMFQTVGKTAVYASKAIGAALKGDFDTAKLYVESIGLAWEKAQEDQRKRAEVLFAKFSGASKEGPSPVFGITEEEIERQLELTDKARKALASKEQAAAEADLRIAQSRLKLRGELNDQAFEKELIGVKEYYRNRREIALESINAEIAALQKRQVQVARSDDEKRLAEIAKIEGEIKRLAVEREIVLAELNAKEAADVERLAKQRIEFDKRVFDSAADEADRALADLARAREEISSRVSAGLLSEVEGSAAIVKLERERIGNLKEMASRMIDLARVQDDPEAEDRANQFLASIREVGIALERERDFGNRLRAVVGDSLTGELADFFDVAKRGALDFGSAFIGVLRGVSAALSSFVSQLLASKIVAALFGAIGGSIGGGSSSGTFAEAPFPMGAEGGVLVGPGTGTSDSILVRGSNGPFYGSVGEFVMPAARTAAPGVLAHLESIRLGSSPVSHWRGGRFADGGLTSGGAAGGRIDGAIELGLSPDLVVRQMDSRAGDRLFIRMAARNRRALGRVFP